ncbi:hypothetical protein [Kitasatospora sp. KL5]|uniref:hypothetical protein n=1 Tax=Kitasatospora sp. KL5 TaxID=3425125 RepID=UPI003D6DF193
MTITFAPLRTRAVVIGVGSILASLIALFLWKPWAHDSAPPLVPASDYSGRPSACLASSDDKDAQPDARNAWLSMQNAAKGLRVNVQQLTVQAAARQEASPYLAGLIAQHCTLIVTVGPAFATAVPDLLNAASGTRFIVINAGIDLHNPRIAQLSGQDAPAQLAERVRDLTKHP